MRVIVFFDLPTTTTEDRREYAKFRRRLIKSGFIMVQESVYSKLALNSTQVNQIVDEVTKIRPAKGLVQILNVTEKQYSKMMLLFGNGSSDVLDSDDRLVII